jgi:hypothetical protein
MKRIDKFFLLHSINNFFDTINTIFASLMVFMRGSCCFCNVEVTVTKPNQHLSSFLDSGSHFYTEEVDQVIFLNVPPNLKK